MPIFFPAKCSYIYKIYLVSTPLTTQTFFKHLILTIARLRVGIGQPSLNLMVCKYLLRVGNMNVVKNGFGNIIFVSLHNRTV